MFGVLIKILTWSTTANRFPFTFYFFIKQKRYNGIEKYDQSALILIYSTL